MVVEYRSIRFGISFYTIWDIVLYDLEYRSIRFGISFYTIWDIVLYDLEYRTIRFGISYYTISGIVIYDFENRYRGFPDPVMGWGEAYFRPETTPTLPPAVQADVFGGNKCHTCGWGDAMSVM